MINTGNLSDLRDYSDKAPRADKRDWRINGDHYGKRQPRKPRRQGTRSGVLAAVRREGGF